MGGSYLWKWAQINVWVLYFLLQGTDDTDPVIFSLTFNFITKS